MRRRHYRCCPESDQPTQIKRVTNIFIKERNSELKRLIFFSYKIKPYLAKSEKIKMIDHKSAYQYDPPASNKKKGQESFSYRLFYSPDKSAHRLPLPYQQNETET